MATRTNNPGSIILEEQHGPAERLLDLVLSSGAHLWHNRPGYDRNGKWVSVKGARAPDGATRVKPGLFVPAATTLYDNLLEIYRLNADLMAHFASYALKETEWRDLKVACAALMLVQPLAGQPVRNKRGEVEFHEDDYRAIGEAMLLYYEKDSKRMMTPKAILRVAQLLELPEIVGLNRGVGFADPASKKPPLGRWKSAARQWLAVREQNLPMLEGLVNAGLKETVKTIARKAGYKPQSQRFFEILGWPQKQSDAGHRSVGLADLDLQKRERFDGLSEEEICERIVERKLKFAEVVGRLPKEVGLTPAIMAALLPSISDRDLRRLTPTLESLDLLSDPDIHARWEAAIQAATDQRALNIAKNVRNKELREKLEGAADQAVRKAVAEAVQEEEIHVMFLVDKSGSMQYAIEQSKEALSRILAGFPPEKLHIASFDTYGTVLKPKVPSRAAVQHMLSRLTDRGGTLHAAGVRALYQSGVRIPGRSKLIVIVAGDEAGERGADFARTFRDCGYDVAAMALIDCAGSWEETENHSFVGRILFGGPQTYTYSNDRGSTVRDCAVELGVPFIDVSVEQFDDSAGVYCRRVRDKMEILV